MLKWLKMALNQFVAQKYIMLKAVYAVYL